MKFGRWTVVHGAAQHNGVFTSKKTILIWMSGIENVGNTCFAAASIQVLRYCQPFVKLMLDSEEPLLNDFFDALYDDGTEGPRKVNFMKRLPEMGYAADCPQDAHEFLMAIVDKIFPSGDNPFEGKITSVLECADAHCSTTTYPFYSLLVYGDVREGLMAYGEAEAVDAKCETCGLPVSKRMSVTTGDVMVVQLARFDGTQKLRHEVHIPHVIENNKRLHLTGVIHHSGSMDNGHYTATVFTKQGWKMINDEYVQPCDPPKTSSTAYVLIYTSGV